MSRSVVVKSFIFAIVLGVSVFLAGCEEFAGEEQFYTIKPAPEQTRQVQTLKLAPKPDGSELLPDVNMPIEADTPPRSEVGLSLEQCRAMTLANNLDLKVQLIAPAIAAQKVSEEEAKFEASFFSNLTYSDTRQPGLAHTESTNVDLGVEVPLRTGGKLKFDVADEWTRTDSTSYSPASSLSISQPLLRDAGKRTNTHSIRILEYQRQITDAQTKLEVIRVLANADRGYWRLYAARRELEVRKKEYELAQAQLKQTRRMVEVGERAEVEVVRSEAGVAERLQNIIIAENELRNRERELKQIMNESGLTMGTPTALVPTTEPDPVLYELDRPRLTAIAIENRMEMLELELQIAQDISSVDYYKNQALPLVTLDYTYRLNGLGETRSDAYDMMTDMNFRDHVGGLKVVIPLGNEAAKSRVLQAVYQRRQRLLSKENRGTLVEKEVLAAIDQLDSNWQSILASRQNAILAGRLYEAEKRQFEVGIRTSTDVLDAQAKFANAQSSEIKSLTEYQIAQIDLAYATGMLLGADKVRWEPSVPSSDTNSPSI
ncbi:MAG: TolC family protein [Phycisphaerae bacterium]|nr:TolC family protein [Phycisphaerae bacterium]MDD5380776.1 TolC family protein [Phycisphaerae bacterium]